jgi:hypothetical protein
MSAQRRHRLLLRAYPRAYRVERGEELLEVLLAQDEGATTWARATEAAALVRHGLTQRLRHVSARHCDRGSSSLAGASLLCLLAVLGARQLLANGQRALGLDGFPAAWQASVLWVDPRWPVHALWLTAGLALLLGRHRLLVAAAWTAVVLHAWLVLAGASVAALPWPGDTGRHWVATGGAAEVGWLVLSAAGALLLGGPSSARQARGEQSGGRWWSAFVLGVAGGGALSVAALWVSEVTDGRRAVDLAVLCGPGPSLVLATAVLGLGVARATHGRRVLALVGVLALVPVGLRWPDATAAVGAAALLVGTGCGVALLTGTAVER